MRRIVCLYRIGCWAGLLCALFVGVGFFNGPVVQAAQSTLAAPSDAQCRGCHGDNQRTLTLTSGEILPLLVDLPRLDASAHSLANAQPVACSDCHQAGDGYRFPHAALTAQNHQAYTTAAAQQCTQCHYPHNPFHEPLAAQAAPGDALAEAKAPTCVDCHGSHQVARVADVAQQMPTQCVACHTDQALAWASDLLAPRPGLGQGDADYAGSARCLGCHTAEYQGWRTTLHAQTVQAVTSNPAAVVGNFAQSDPARTFDLTQVAYTLGVQWKQQYLTRTVEGTLQLLPAQWHVAPQEWAAYHAPAGQSSDWRQACSGCHVTGLATQDWSFTEFGVGCESCHGPSAKHVADPETVKPYAQVDDQVCGACHSQGSSPTGLAFPATYRPGLTLTDHFTFTTAAEHIWPDGSAKIHAQQYMDWQLGSRMAQDPSTNCVSCHTVHGAGHGPAQLKAPLPTLCVGCHAEKRALYAHTPYHQAASLKQDFSCADCHMPKLATSAVAFDIHNHSFLQPNPQASLDHGGVANMPNACNQCHTGQAEDATWAVQTVAYVKAQGIVGKKSLFTPGLAPTPPPPPTPLPSVGQPAAPYYVETGAWLRNAAYAAGGLLLLMVLILIYRARQSRRSTHAGAD